jgi:glycosyltransferase involved in cell wall biosynthesis
MCTYNGARFLEEQLTSLVAQSRRPDEVVVCDDGSTDASVALLRAFAAEAPFSVLVHENQNRLGSTKNFERAISLCTGELIYLCDQDDIWDSEKIGLTENRFIDDPNVSLVFTNAEVVDDNAKSLGYTLWERLRIDKELQTRLQTSGALEVLLERPIVTGATMAFPSRFRDLVIPIPGDISLIHDGWIALMLSLVGPFNLIDRPLLKYRQHEAQQLGVPDITRPAPILANANRRNDFEPEIRKLEAVCERLQANEHRYESQHAEILRDRLNHLHQRITISRSKLSGVRLAINELVSGRYHRYSNGLYSLMKDLVN